MDERLTIARSELILGGQKSGKSRRAELLARNWLGQSASHHAVLIATAQPWDEEMRTRIARHQTDRAERVPGLRTVEKSHQLSEALQKHSRPDTLVVVDCLTLWLTNWLMPMEPVPGRDLKLNSPLAGVSVAPVAMLLDTLAKVPGPVVLVGNEIGLGVIPMGAEVRAFVDSLGHLNQDVARVCRRVTLMAAGLPLTLKDAP
ncbi:MAG: bifunctional adenosylcobinamide kinase/adenosylcobinamide-phosphate guanylyltransferase [Rhodoferax sp.]|nr:bifunctional adenosylcobinamide kinase/adenosylcobinamide-phosphate guanylyltransferase [Rhodoferax sp.]